MSARAETVSLPPARPIAPRAGHALIRRGDDGQATVELVVLLPLLAAIALALLAFLAGQGAREAADQAAVAGAVAQLQGRDAVEAAKAASPSWTRPRVRLVRGRVTVRIAPRVPRFIADQIDAERSVTVDPAGGS